jgi:hypothetical protein
MKKPDITAFREMATDFLAGELSQKQKEDFSKLINSDETFSAEFRLLEKAWTKAAKAKEDIAVPKMSDRLLAELDGELLDDDLDMVSGGVKKDPEVDTDDFDT